MTIHHRNPLWTTKRKAVLAALLAAQFAIAYIVGTGHLLPNTGAYLVPPIGVTVALPVMLFFAAYGLSQKFRGFVLAQDIRTLTSLQHWRVVGFVFLPLYSFGVLPGLFAWPAGVGDVAVGLTAAFVVARMDRDPDFVTSRGFLGFHLMGLADFTVAIVTSGLAAGAFPALVANGVTSAPLDVWPLNIFPSFIVPAFIIVQVAAILKHRQLRQARGTAADIAPQAA